MELAVKEKSLSKEDMTEEINRLRREKNAVILAHYYQENEIQEIADFKGDSLALAQKAAETDADMIVFAGVYFMAETAKILNPDKKVVIPDRNAGCSLVDGCPPDAFKTFKNQHPDHMVISYVNSSLEIKMMSDYICTSSNAVDIVNAVPRDKKILFAPDQHLGRWVAQQTGRDLTLWKGECIVHQAFAMDKLASLMQNHPDAELIAHPESDAATLRLASFTGSTSALIKRVKHSLKNKFIIATEGGILHEMRKQAPDKKLIAAPAHENNSCACSECAFMKLNTMEKLHACMADEHPEVTVTEEDAKKALIPLNRMLELSK